MNARDMLFKYMDEFGLKKVTDIVELTAWITKVTGRPMDRRLFVARGPGGGQGYKILYGVFDTNGNNNRLCYFYSENRRAINELESNGHISLDNWLQRGRKRLKSEQVKVKRKQRLPTGWLYIVTEINRDCPVKIGYTSKDPDTRLQGIDSTGNHIELVVRKRYLVKNPYDKEQEIHKLLHAERIRPDREWFNCSLEDAHDLITGLYNNSILHQE